MIIDANCCHYLFISLAVTICAFVFSLSNKMRILIFTLSGVSGPFLFTNLYTVHDYYSAANTILFSFAIGLFVVSVWDIRKKILYSLPSSIHIVFIVWNSVTCYLDTYYKVQVRDNTALSRVATEIKNLTSPDDVVLVIGRDWSSEIAYYSTRKTVAIPGWMLQELDNDVDGFLNNFESSGITVFAAVEHNATLSDVNLKVAEHYGLSRIPYQVAGGYCLLFKK
jgi:hypothetical protein